MPGSINRLSIAYGTYIFVKLHYMEVVSCRNLKLQYVGVHYYGDKVKRICELHFRNILML